MKKYGVIFCCLGCFALCVSFLEKGAFFSGLKTSLQRQEVSSSILDIGKMGKILKEQGMIITLPKKELGLSATALDLSKSLLEIELEVSVATELQVYWTEKKDQKYTVKRCGKVAVSAGKKQYFLSLPPLPDMHRLRIDPSTKPADIRICRVILYYGDQEIVLSADKGLDLLKPLAGIGRLHHDSGGLSFAALNTDPQLELRLDTVKKTRKIEKLAFQRKRRETSFRHAAGIGGMRSFPSSKIITKKHFRKNWPVMSLVFDEAALYHPDTGLIPNKSSRGRQWERPAYCSYFDKQGKLRFASLVGVRMHGGKRMQLYSSYRLYFRKEYGLSSFSEFTPEIAFSSRAEPVKRLVVHHTAWPEGGWYFNNTLAYDISRRIGCQVPETKLALLYVNGVEQGIYFFVPHIGERLLRGYFGHDKFNFYKFRSSVSREALALNVGLWGIANKKEKLTMKRIGREIDLDNLARHLFSVLFCGTTDWYQGVAVRDAGKTESKIFWINWDMDQSFIQDVSSQDVLMTEWQQRSWSLIYTEIPEKSLDIRPKIFSRLLREDPAYRQYVLTLYRDLLNHRLNARFATERIAYYTAMLEDYGKQNTRYMQMLGEFMKRRAEVVRKETEALFQLGPSLLCRITGPSDMQYEIDGYQEPAGYQGYYFKGSRIRVRVNRDAEKKLVYWLVNGKRTDRKLLDIEVKENLIIEPFFEGND
ncbi:MAG: hypothetical protein D3914_02005 [Candidatus Electrothrix sp. LOE2]|nr:hypothetical protein [Candidatus Electrothrix sp. LOE2]